MPVSPSSRLGEFTFFVAVGFQRDGVALENKPKDSSCYTVTAKTKLGVDNENGNYTEANAKKDKNKVKIANFDPEKEKEAIFWSENDVIGCGYDSVKRMMWFTKNGIRSKSFFWQNVSGTFFPAVWIEAKGVLVEVNFGHERFLYDFEGTLPKEYIVFILRTAQFS